MDKMYKAQAISLLFSGFVFSFQEPGRAGPGSSRQRVSHMRPRLLSRLSGRRRRSQPQGQPVKLTVRWEIVPRIDIIEHDLFPFFQSRHNVHFSFYLLLQKSSPGECITSNNKNKKSFIPLSHGLNSDTVSLSRSIVCQSSHQ